MAINYTAPSFTGGTPSGVQLTQAFAQIEAVLKDAVGRSGNTPNAMESDLDLNGYDLLNVSSLGGKLLTTKDLVPLMSQDTVFSNQIGALQSQLGFQEDRTDAALTRIGAVEVSTSSNRTGLNQLQSTVAELASSTGNAALTSAEISSLVDDAAAELKVDLSGANTFVGFIEDGESFPIFPETGQYVINQDNGVASRWNGAAWVDAPELNIVDLPDLSDLVNTEGRGTQLQMYSSIGYTSWLEIEDGILIADWAYVDGGWQRKGDLLLNVSGRGTIAERDAALDQVLNWTHIENGAVVGSYSRAVEGGAWLDDNAVGTWKGIKAENPSTPDKVDDLSAALDRSLVTIPAFFESADGLSAESIKLPASEFRRFNKSDPRYYAPDTTTEWSAAFTSCADEGRTIQLQPGKTYPLDNWVAPTDTTLIAHGATVERASNSQYYADIIDKGSAAIVVLNPRIKIYGGTWKTGPAASFLKSDSGAIFCEGGSLDLHGAYFTENWGGVFGVLHEYNEPHNLTGTVAPTATNDASDTVNASDGIGFQLRSKWYVPETETTYTCTDPTVGAAVWVEDPIMDYLTINKCLFEGNHHAAWLSDIRVLTVDGMISRENNRDGLRVQQNVRKTTIVNGWFYNNGNDDAGVSKDGIDLFPSSGRVIVTGNHIFGNVSNGIDIKTSVSDFSLSSGPIEQISIGSNHVDNNTESGIKIDQNAGAQTLSRFDITGGSASGNGLNGVWLSGASRGIVKGVDTSDNGKSGVLAEGANGIDIEVHGEGNGTNTASSDSKTLVTVDSASTNVNVRGCRTENIGDVQAYGISHKGTGSVVRNDISGHVYNYITEKTDGSLVGKSVVVVIPMGDNTLKHPIYHASKGETLISAEVVFSEAVTSAQVLIENVRDTGVFYGTSVDDTVTIGVAHKSQNLNVASTGVGTLIRENYTLRASAGVTGSTGTAVIKLNIAGS